MDSIRVAKFGGRPSYYTQNYAPFKLTTHGERVIGYVIPPTAKWYECEKCGDNTQNLEKFYNKDRKVWEKLVLCDPCRDQLRKDGLIQ